MCGESCVHRRILLASSCQDLYAAPYESSSRSASDLIRSVPVAFRNMRKILFDFLACSLNRRSVRQCHFHTFSLSMLAVCRLYCSFGQSQVVLSGPIMNAPVPTLRKSWPETRSYIAPSDSPREFVKRTGIELNTSIPSLEIFAENSL